MTSSQRRKLSRTAGLIVVALTISGFMVACVPPGTWNGQCSNGTIPPESNSLIASHCAGPTTTASPTTTTSIPVQECNDATNSGGPGVTVTEHELGASSGSFTISWEMYSIPDELVVTYDGVQVFTTGGPVSGAGLQVINYGPGAATSVVVTITGPSGTLWDYLVQCPD